MRPLFCALLLSASVGCQDYLFEQKCPERISEQKIARSVAKPRPSDILFIVDDSGSMADEQERLAVNFDAFINELTSIEHDYRIGVVTTDLTNANNRTGLVRYDYSDMSMYRHAYSVDYQSCGNAMVSQACVRGPEPSKRIIDSATMTPAEQIAAFNNNVQVGSCGAFAEKGLEAMLLALEKTETCNAGFARSGANLVLIFVSDEDDAGDGDVSALVDRLETLRPITDVRVAAVVGFDGTDASDCSTKPAGTSCGSLCNSGPPPEGSHAVCTTNTGCAEELEFCDKRRGEATGTCESLAGLNWGPESCRSCSLFDVDDCCTAQSGGRYVRFAREVETRIAAAGIGISAHGCLPPEGARAACLLDSVCQDSFAATLSKIARDLVVPTDYDLDPIPPDPTKVTARISGGRFGDGVDLVAGEDFTISPMGRTLSVNPDKAPLEDETLDIAYVVEVVDSTDVPRGACGLPPP